MFKYLIFLIFFSALAPREIEGSSLNQKSTMSRADNEKYVLKLFSNYKSNFYKIIDMKIDEFIHLSPLELLDIKNSQEYKYCNSKSYKNSNNDKCNSLFKILYPKEKVIIDKKSDAKRSKIIYEFDSSAHKVSVLLNDTYLLNDQSFVKKYVEELKLSLEWIKLDLRYSKDEQEKTNEKCKKRNKPYVICFLEQSYIFATIRANMIRNAQKNLVSKLIDQLMTDYLSRIYDDYGKPCNPKYDYSFRKTVDQLILDFDKVLKKREWYLEEGKTEEFYNSFSSLHPKSNFFQLSITGEKNEKRICTASQLKIKDVCYTLTNEHCISGIKKPKITLKTGSDNEPTSFRSRDFSVDIERSDNQSELVLLSIPKKLNKQYCPRIFNTKILSTEEIINDQSLKLPVGYTKEGHIEYFNNYRSDNEKLDSYIPKGRKIKSALKNIKHFIEFKSLDVGPGMSGGAVLNNNGDVLGITTRNIPLQDTPWVIPMDEVYEFIQGKEESLTKNEKLYNVDLYQSRSKKYSIADNIVEKPGDNTAGMPGDNTAGMPGDNTAGMPNDNIKNFEDNNLNKFIESHEGIIDFNDDSRRKLIAVKSLDGTWKQIDGNDDYLFKSPDVTKLEEGQKIYLKDDGSLPSEVRDQTIGNLVGNYDYSNSRYFGREITYKPNRKSINGMKKIKNNNQYDEIKITQNSIELNFGDKKKIRFEINYSNDKNSIILSRENGSKLKCENRSLNKLICKGEKEAFSLSMLDSKTKHLSYKYVTLDDENRYHYNFGDFINDGKNE